MGFCGMTISELVKSLVLYAEKEGLVLKEDSVWATNRILEVLSLSSFDKDASAKEMELEEILKGILDYCNFPGLWEKYHKKYGYAYEVNSDKNEELMDLFTEVCRKG